MGGESAPKQQKNPSYFIPELAHIVNMCDEKLPFVCLAQELSNRNIPHSGLQIEANATSLVLELLSLPQPGCQHTTPENKVNLFGSKLKISLTTSIYIDWNKCTNCRQSCLEWTNETFVIGVCSNALDN